jgi:OmpA-OmpF porin, OOP family
MRFPRGSFWAAALCLLATPAMAQVFGSPGTGPDGFYLRGEGGWSHMNDMTGRTSGGTPNGTIYTSKQNDGYLFGGAVGWKSDQLRVELGLDFSNSGIKEIDVNNVRDGSASGSVHNTAGMLNVIWDMRTGTNWVPYIGIGVGASYATLDNVKYNGTLQSNSSDLVFAYQPIVGVDYHFTPNLALGLQYRYFSTVDPSFNYAPGGKLGLKNESHNVLLALTWFLNVPQAAAAAPPSPPPPPPAPPPPQVNPQAGPPPAPAPLVYIVFFNTNSAQLTAEGRRVVEQAVVAFGQNGRTNIQLTGYTDATASAKYDLALSQNRAYAVRDYLVHLGVPASDIEVAWNGKADQRVTTADHVPEPQNRRVEIIIP